MVTQNNPKDKAPCLIVQLRSIKLWLTSNFVFFLLLSSLSKRGSWSVFTNSIIEKQRCQWKRTWRIFSSEHPISPTHGINQWIFFDSGFRLTLSLDLFLSRSFCPSVKDSRWVDLEAPALLQPQLPLDLFTYKATGIFQLNKSPGVLLKAWRPFL